MQILHSIYKIGSKFIKISSPVSKSGWIAKYLKKKTLINVMKIISNIDYMCFNNLLN